MSHPPFDAIAYEQSHGFAATVDVELAPGDVVTLDGSEALWRFVFMVKMPCCGVEVALFENPAKEFMTEWRGMYCTCGDKQTWTFSIDRDADDEWFDDVDDEWFDDVDDEWFDDVDDE